MALWDKATWLGPPDLNYSGPMVEVRGLVLHIAEGSYQGTISWQKNDVSDVSSHFIFGLVEGERAQMLDTNVTAWTQSSGNGHWVSVENAGYHYNQFTPAQVEANAQLYAWLHQVYNIPMQLADTPSGRGLGWHGMGGASWGGHYDCPGPANVALRSTILARAQEILAPPTQRRGQDDMLMVAKSGAGPNGETVPGHSRWWAGDGLYYREIPNEGTANNLINAIKLFYGDPRAAILSWGDSSPEAVQAIIGSIPADNPAVGG
jgi:hypothetical protein